jgi:hypothetical protein
MGLITFAELSLLTPEQLLLEEQLPQHWTAYEIQKLIRLRYRST